MTREEGQFSYVDALRASCDDVVRAESSLRFATRTEREAALRRVHRAWKTVVNASGLFSVRLLDAKISDPRSDQRDDRLSTEVRWRSALASFFSRWLASTPYRDQHALLGDDGIRTTRRFVHCYASSSAPLLREQTLIDEQLQAIDVLSLSTRVPFFPLGDLRLRLQSPLRKEREASWRALSDRLDGTRQEAAERFAALHATRRDIADVSGYHHFGEYAIRRHRLTDAFRAAVPSFREAVRRHFIPLMPAIHALQKKRLDLERLEPWDLLYPAPFGSPRLHPADATFHKKESDDSSFKEDAPDARSGSLDLPEQNAEAAPPLEEIWISILRRMLTIRVPRFENMAVEGTIALKVLSDRPESDASGDGRPNPVVTVAPFFDPPHVCLAFSDMPQECFAHALFFLSGTLMLDAPAGDDVSSELFYTLERALSPVDDESADDAAPLPSYIPPSSVTACAAGYSFSVLSRDMWSHYYGPMADYAAQYAVTTFVSAVLYAAALDEMDEFLATTPLSDASLFQKTWRAIAERYRLPGTDADTPSLFPVDDLFLLAPSLLRKPLAGIVPALSLVSVLGMLPFGKNIVKLKQHYPQLLNTREARDPLARIVRAGYPSPLEEETVEKAAFAIADFLAL